MKILNSEENAKLEKELNLHLGDWKRSIPYKDETFAKDKELEPHHKRKKTILKRYPQIESLYGHDKRSILIIIILVLAQLILSFLITQYDSWVLFFTLAYFVGGTITNIYGVLIHEICHNLVHSSPLVNRLCALLVNTCIPFPIAASFRRYHMDHHLFQGIENRDPDLPLKFEYKLIKGNSILKLIWLFMYPLMYVVRGMANIKPLSFWEAINIIYVVICDFIIFKFIGLKALFYLFCSLWLGYGLHIGAAHFIQEHYTFVDGQETYSYYGSLNFIFLNIGYHNEHHDFMNIPWSSLPKIKEIASEFYVLKFHYSWFLTIIGFVFENCMGPQSRVVRSNKIN